MTLSASEAPASGRRIHLLGGPWVTIDGSHREIPDGAKRLLTFLALDRRTLDRRYVAGTLWPEGDEEHACGCLRTALWRLRHAGIDLVEVSKTTLRLHPDVSVDSEELRLWALRVLNDRIVTDDLTVLWDITQALDLLPGWYEDWVEAHREGLRQLLLHALDALGRQLSAAGHHADAVTLAQRTVDADPLRESAQEVLLSAHLAEGNLAEARRTLARFEHLLLTELHVLPPARLYEMTGLDAPTTGGPTRSQPGGERIRRAP